MKEFLGSSIVDIDNTPFKEYDASNLVLYFLENHGGVDGVHHKDWLIDQVARILNGTKPIIKLAKWSDGTEEYRIELCEPTDKYRKWVSEVKNGEDGPETYFWNIGITP